MELISEEYFEDQEGQKVRRTYRGKTIDGKPKESIHLLVPSQWYLDNVLEPTRADTEVFHQILEKGKKVGERLTQLGEARSDDPTRIATEDAVFDAITSVVETGELGQVALKLEWIGDKTFQQVDDYIDSNVTNLSEAKAFLKVLAKVVLANLKLMRIMAVRELPPVEP